MKIISRQGDPNLAEVYVAQFRNSQAHLAEFVDAKDPELPRNKKWVIIISTQFGCPIDCPICDAGGNYAGDLTATEMLAQIDHVVSQRAPNRMIPTEKFKIQFARMGEPALNPAVLEVLEKLPSHFDAPGLMPCIATTAPRASGSWLEDLLNVRQSRYAGKPFQLQFSINSTDASARDRLMPAPKWGLDEIGAYARRFHQPGDRKVTLNFALTEAIPIDDAIIAQLFDPDTCCIKLTPLNPTLKSQQTALKTSLPPSSPEHADNLCGRLKARGFDVILSIGDERENQIGSNCGMAVRYLRADAL